MGFFDDFVDVAKDVGTSATRIVTDTAIDLGDVATGFQFSDEMSTAKRKMSEAGILSAADAIEKNHYGFLKDMEKEAQAKYDTVALLYKDGQSAELARDKKADSLANMLQDADVLAQMSSEAQTLLAKARSIPDWEKWMDVLDISDDALNSLDTSVSKWNEVGQKIMLANLGTNAASGVTGLVGLSALAKASKGLKASKLSSAASKGSKFAKVGKLASRASVVLAVATVGLDIGLSVVELEKREDDLTKNIKALDEGISEANRDITSLRKETRQIGLRIYEVLNSVEPPQTEISWDGWVEATRASLEKLRSRLVDAYSIRAKAIQIAQKTKGHPMASREQLVASVDINISIEEARDIISLVDNEKLDSTVVEAPVVSPSSTAKKALNWQVEGPGKTSISPSTSADAITFEYSLSGKSVWKRQTWTYTAKATKTTTLTFAWQYSGFHAWYKPFVHISAFAEGAAPGTESERTLVTLLEGTQRKGQGEAEIEVSAGETFGFVIQGSNFDRDSRLLGELTLTFEA